MASSDVLSGTFAGRYTIERELGSGATATVYLARDTQRGISVAVKLLRPELAQSVGADRFLREIRLNEKLHHPHIVPVLDSGEHDGRLYFVLPHMEEGSLRQMLQREKQLPIETAIAIARTIAQALDYAHQQKLIHRDVKPENILFTSGQACLADFGIARAVERAMDDSTTDTGMVRGTPAYMSPEQASGSRQYDGRSDQYSLACVLYEMLAGVPAFIGPTPEAVIAQRFQHAPRELRVYRPTVPENVETVIQRALALAPADRFSTTAEFSQALEMAPRTPTVERRASGPSIGLTRRKLGAFAGAVGLVGLLIALAVRAGTAGSLFGNRLTQSDSTRYSILPIEADSALPSSEAYDRLHGAFARWSGIEIVSRFDVREALGGEAPVISDADAIAASRRLRTGRYVRARLARAGAGFTLTAVLSDAVTARRLIEISAPIDQTVAHGTADFDRIAAALLLRSAQAAEPASRVLPAAQLYLQAMAEQRAFRLDRADSLFAEALEHDRDFASASLWLAQVRAWRLGIPGVENWLPWAQRAVTSPSLSGRERLLARALVAMGQRRFDEACGIYRTITAEDPRSFEGWYGLGQCRDWDRVVVADSRSPSGWRYRSSYHQAVRAYARAFELAPLVHRNFEARAFSQLRVLLYAGRALGRQGQALSPDATQFVAYPSWAGDSLVFVPYPLSAVRAGISHDRAARARAASEQLALFGRIARSWSAAFPRNASAKEAVAIALEMSGDAASLDTLRLARSLAEDEEHKLRLAVEEVLFRTSLARRSPAVLAEAGRLADSLLSAIPHPTVEQAKQLSPVAALRGRCALSSRLSAITASRGFGDFPNIPRSAIAAADSLSILVALGCAPFTRNAMDAIASMAAVAARVDTVDLPRLEYSLFARAFALSQSRDSALLGRATRASADWLLRAQYDLARGDSSNVRSVLAARERVRGPTGTADVTPDGVLPETLLWLALGDSAKARLWPEPMLRRASWLEHLLDDPFAAASLMRTAVLRADLARAANDSAVAAQWDNFVLKLWGSGDKELAAVARRPKR